VQLVVIIPDEFDQRVLEAYGSNEVDIASGTSGAWTPATQAQIEERLAGDVRRFTYAYEDQKFGIAIQEERANEQW
jgi:hypothetical protein